MTASDDSQQAVLESLSAMFDDEANQQDLHDLMAQDSADLNDKMAAFHLIQHTLRKETDVDLNIQSGFNLAARVSAQIEQETGEKNASNVVALAPLLPSLTPDMVSDIAPQKRYFWSGFAVAASVAFAIVVGGNLLLNPEPNKAPTVAAHTASDIDTLTVPVTSLAELKKQPMDIDNLRLQNYLRQHAEQATMTVGRGMIPMARIASYPIKE
ncbi:sigma-E factor negative regulatory protein [Marinomonas pollencensis]|uniref:RseA-like anti sigma(E) protein n=1 Tax=Marinomonas pollencensis TaxID=491954 RepID=A0A3E0DL78_9GAMM|nr:sigma-E factor negative regulatory protein [Marinomonas pollencensis]REG82854.1 RseA-like anti sigma(E) protein [Marinomonas pollencensis]